MYQKRSTSKKRAADADQKINMDEKEATPVEEVEEVLPPKEPEQPTQSGDANIMEMMKFMKEQFQKMDDSNKELKADNQRNLESLKEELKTDNQKNLESLKEELSGKIDNTNKKIDELKQDSQRNMETLNAVSYTHLDVYKRQVQYFINVFLILTQILISIITLLISFQF